MTAGGGASLRRRIGLVAGPAAFFLLLSLPPPTGLEPVAWRTAAMGVLMATWWLTEAIPIPATALLPLVLLPLLGVGTIAEAATPYANPVIFLFLGGFLIALGMQRWGLHRRIALHLLLRAGARPAGLVAGFMAATAFLSMWVSNSATAMMMLPIGLSVIGLVVGSTDPPQGSEGSNFAVALLLGIAYTANIGGLATLIGTPPNAFLAGFLSEVYGVELGFARWLLVGLPVTLVGLPLVFLVLTRIAYPIRLPPLPEGRRLIRRQLDGLGGMRRQERAVATVFAATAGLWIARPLLERWVPGLSDAGIAMAGGLALFLLPSDLRRGEFLLDWEWARRLPWDLLILFGGGLSLASAVERTGLAGWLGGAAAGAGDVSLLVLTISVTAVIVFLTELTSNTATAATFLPVVSAVAVQGGWDPLLLAVPAALAASCAFMLPVATPPNAIVYGSHLVSIPQMARAGLMLNGVFVVVVTAAGYLLVPLVFGGRP